jgi:hypothetical protein
MTHASAASAGELGHDHLPGADGPPSILHANPVPGAS